MRAGGSHSQVLMPQAARTLPDTKRVIPLLSLLPAEIRQRLSGRPAVSDRMPAVCLPLHVRRLIRTPKKISASSWAAQYRVVTDGAHPGPWRKEYAAHTVRILDTFGLPHVREIWFCGVDQSGKTITLTNCLAWSAEHLAGDIFYLMPSEETAKNIVDQKLRPMLEQSPRLRRLLSPRKDDTAVTRIRLRNGKTIRPSWAGSPTAMATWSAQCCFGDEVDKFPEQSGKESDPITMIRKRARTFRGRSKMFFCSTPAGRFIRKGVDACAQVWESRVRCPHCGELIKMDGEHLLIQDGATMETIEAIGCEYACNNCGATMDEQDRQDGITSGEWVAAKGADIERPEKVGFVHRAWDCADVTLKEIAIAWIKKENGALTDKIAWANGVEAEDYQHEQVDRKQDYILRLVESTRPRGVVPADTSAVLLLVDTQKRGFFYQVWACGYGPDVPTALIDHGYVEKFQHLADMSAGEWKEASGRPHRLLRAYIDSGGGTDPHSPKHSRTSAVYEFCRRNRTFRPIKGYTRQDTLWTAKKIDFYPTRDGKKIPMVGGPVLYQLQVDHFKNELSEKLMIELGDQGGISLHAGTGSDFAAQMCAEYADERGHWHCPRGKANHHWDCGVYLRAAVTIEQLTTRRKEVQRQRRVIVHSKGVQL